MVWWPIVANVLSGILSKNGGAGSGVIRNALSMTANSARKVPEPQSNQMGG